MSGVILWEGASPLDGKPIVLLAIKDTKNLIPTFVDATFEKGQQILKGASQMLKVKAIHNERIRKS